RKWHDKAIKKGNSRIRPRSVKDSSGRNEIQARQFLVKILESLSLFIRVRLYFRKARRNSSGNLLIVKLQGLIYLINRCGNSFPARNCLVLFVNVDRYFIPQVVYHRNPARTPRRKI